MEVFKHRIGAKIIAIVDLILSSITLTALAVISILLLLGLEVVVVSLPKNARVEDGGILLIAGLTVLMIIVIALEILGLVAALKLLRSTSTGAYFMEAADQARFWRNLSILNLFLSAIALIFGNLLSIIFIAFRIIGLIFVGNYIQELDAAVSRQPYNASYAVVGGGRVLNAPPGSVMVAMNGQHQPNPQAGFVYPNLSQAEAGQFADFGKQ